MTTSRLQDYSVLAVIPARGGSKGVPRKNLRIVAGKPLIVRTVETCLAAKTVSRVVVSTDDPAIGELSQRSGAEVVWRPPEISGDHARSEEAVLHVLDTLRHSEGYVPDIVLLVQCTSPLTLSEDIDATVYKLLQEGADCAFAATLFHGFLWRTDEVLGAVGINHDSTVRLRRQDLPPQYLETGAVYAMRTEGFLKARHRFFGRLALYVMPSERCLEIDSPHDLITASVLLRERQRNERLSCLPWPVAAVVLDFDGVLTDNRVITTQDGHEAVLCNRSDGLALSRLKTLGIRLLVLSAEENPVVGARCAKLGIPCIQGCSDKLSALQAWAREEGINLNNVIYVGNDVNDISCLQAVGCGVVVGDAHPTARSVARITLKAKGGYGAVRELADMILERAGVEDRA
ncbi:MAG: cytidylyltransferase domain-containing protein [Moorellales bacterium]